MSLSLAACGEDEGDPVGPDSPGPAAAISLTADADTVRIGRSLTLSATVLDASGNVLTGRPVTWSSSHPLHASVSATGLLTGLKVAQGISVTASSWGVQGSFTLAVLEDPIVSVEITPDSASIEVQDSAVFSVVVLNDLGDEVKNPLLTWTSSNTAVGTIDDSAMLRGVNGGTIRLYAEAGGVVDSASVSVEVVLRGEAEATDGGPLGGVAFFLETKHGVDSTLVEADGGVELRTTRPIVGEVSRMFFRAIDEEGMRLLPSLRRAQPISPSIGDSLFRAMLIPKRVLNADGSLSPIQLSMFLGHYPVSDVYGDGQTYARSGLYGNNFTFLSGGWKYSPALWREYPVPVVFNRGFSAVTGVSDGPFPSLEISSADSAAFWAHLDKMNLTMGRQLVVPARWDDFSLDTAWVDGRPIEKPIGAIKIDFPDWSDYQGEGGPGSAAAAWPETSWCEDVDCYIRYHDTGTAVFYGPGWPGSADGVAQLDGRLATHEVIHTLGFGHTCFWPSLMDTSSIWYEFSICRELGTGALVRPFWGKGYPTPHDVVYISAFIDLVGIYHETKPWFGIWEASEGEREFIHHLPPDVLVTR